ncbi:protein-glutamine glutaminase family protein [Paraburkholderia xenovorans]|uniref:protein-glutamine glutaminase family protein n=1 Tax=Paraburkholderia xenovorans TaxID=36873 RepID=UPI0038BB7DDD
MCKKHISFVKYYAAILLSLSVASIQARPTPPSKTENATANELDISSIPVSTMDQINRMFNLQDKFVYNWSNGDVPYGSTPVTVSRRITWTYPVDGCYLRAAMLIGSITRSSLQDKSVSPQLLSTHLKKLFVWGNLTAQSNNVKAGRVNWGYHVAPVARTVEADGKSTVYVLDPALNSQPVTLDSWSNLVTYGEPSEKRNLKFSVCDTDVYFPGQNNRCGTRQSTSQTRSDSQKFLFLEWNNYKIVNQGANPYAALANSEIIENSAAAKYLAISATAIPYPSYWAALSYLHMYGAQ